MTDINKGSDATGTVAAPSVDAQAILEKYDRESVTRNPKSTFVRYLIAVIAILYSAFHLYITFNPLPELVQRSVHVAVGLVLIFLLYPAGKKAAERLWRGVTGCGWQHLFLVWRI